MGMSAIRHLHISHKAPYLPPKILHNLCFSFLLGITAVPRQTENSTYAKRWGQIRCIMDVQVVNQLKYPTKSYRERLGTRQHFVILSHANFTRVKII